MFASVVCRSVLCSRRWPFVERRKANHASVPGICFVDFEEDESVQGRGKIMEVMLVLAYLRILRSCANAFYNGRLRSTAGSRSKVLRSRNRLVHRCIASCQRTPFCKSCVRDNGEKREKKIKLCNDRSLMLMIYYWLILRTALRNR